MSWLKDGVDALVGKTTSTTSSTTTQNVPSTNYPMVIGGIVMAVLVVVGIVYLVKRSKGA